MAYLNVKERRLEARIAYVGATDSGRGTNLGHLGDTRLVDDRLALFWKPANEVSFRDCSVRAELFTTRGNTSADTVRELVRASDGVVFVADAAPAAAERNREVLALLRTALAEISHAIPVVVQLNKTDLADGADVLRALDVSDWPHVEASAMSGAGVVETAERALELVLETLRRHDVGALAEAAPAVSNRDKSPLLTALRQVLRETVAEYVDETEKRLQPQLARMVADLAQLQHDFANLRSSQNAIYETVVSLSDTTEGMTLESVRQGRVLGDLVESAAARAKHDADVVRTLDQLTKADREQQTLLTGAKRVLETLPGELKSEVKTEVRTEIRALDSRAAIYAMKNEVQRVGDELGHQVKEADATALRLFGELDAKATALGATLDSLIEELKKPKKGWFG